MRIMMVAVLAAASVGVADEPPPFGTELGRWNLQMSGAYAGTGMTWRKDDGRLYLMDQGYSGVAGVWSLRPEDPVGSIQPEPWVLANLGSQAQDIPFGIVWDPDSFCFWISQIVDGSVYNDCYLLRMEQLDTAWRWRGLPQDSWKIDTGDIYWMAGMAKWDDRPYFIGSPVRAYPVSASFMKFDPYTKSVVGSIPVPFWPGRCVGLVPADSYYILTSGDSSPHLKLDSMGAIVQRAGQGAYGPAGRCVVVPQDPMPGDTVVYFDICSDPGNTLMKISAGMTWGQLRRGGAIAEPPGGTWRVDYGGATIVRGELRLPQAAGTGPSASRKPQATSLLDAAGRKVMTLKPGPNDVSSLYSGIYFVREEPQASSPKPQAQTVRKVVIQH